MPKYVYKIGDNEYVEFSTIVDNCTTYILDRDQMIALLTEPGSRHAMQLSEAKERLDRVDEVFCSARVPGCQFKSADEALKDMLGTINDVHHADYDEDEDRYIWRDDALTPETFREKYTYKGSDKPIKIIVHDGDTGETREWWSSRKQVKNIRRALKAYKGTSNELSERFRFDD